MVQKDRRTFFPLEIPQNGVQLSSSSLTLTCICPFFVLPIISPTFTSFPSKELSMGINAKGPAFGVYRSVFSRLAAAHFGF